MSDIRKDRLHDHYVLIAPERMRKPDTLGNTAVGEPIDDCPFCEGHEGMTPPEIYAIRSNEANAMHWSVRVIPNLYKAVQIELDNHSDIDGMFESRLGLGAHEIVIDTPQHDGRLSTMKVTQISDWLQAISERISDLKADKRLIYASVFKNHGTSSGATQFHPHTQIIALPVMPQSLLKRLERGLQYYRRHGRSRLEDILANELKAEVRIVSKKGTFTAFCPFASSYPFEVMIASTSESTSLYKLNRDDIGHLASLIQEVFQRLEAELGNFNYNLAFDMAPLNSNFENEPFMPQLEKYYRMNIRIMPRIYRLGGFELSTGIFINPVAPEEAAKLLRETKI